MLSPKSTAPIRCWGSGTADGPARLRMGWHEKATLRTLRASVYYIELLDLSKDLCTARRSLRQANYAHCTVFALELACVCVCVLNNNLADSNSQVPRIVYTYIVCNILCSTTFGGLCKTIPKPVFLKALAACSMIDFPRCVTTISTWYFSTGMLYMNDQHRQSRQSLATIMHA